LVWAIAVVTVSYALFTLYEYYKPRTFYDNEVTDEEYITITNQTLANIRSPEISREIS